MASDPGILGLHTRGAGEGVASEVGRYARQLDFLLLAGVAALIGYGLWIVRSVTIDDVPGDPSHYLTRQGIAVALGVVAMVALAALDAERLVRLRVPLYGLLLGLLALVLVTDRIRGSRRWIEIGFFRLQPSELGKLLLIFVLAAFVADRVRRGARAGGVLGAAGLAAVPILLVFVQPDFGTALVYSVALAAVLYFTGTRWPYMAGLAALGSGAAAAFLWLLPSNGVHVLRQYQIDRLIGFLHPDADPSGITYNITQSITAVGAGGLDGRGAAGATQTNLNYLPEHATDFVFSSLAEQRGFLGAAILLLLYVLVVWRGIRIIGIAPTLFTSAVAGAIVVTFLFQLFVNVGMTIGIAPVVGIPLPFVSYGGSSMLATLAMMGVLQGIHIRGRLASRR